MLCKESHTLAEEAAAAEKARSLGVPAEVLDAQQTAKLDPGIRMKDVRWARVCSKQSPGRSSAPGITQSFADPTGKAITSFTTHGIQK